MPSRDPGKDGLRTHYVPRKPPIRFLIGVVCLNLQLAASVLLPYLCYLWQISTFDSSSLSFVLHRNFYSCHLMSSCGCLIAGEVPSAPLLMVKWVQSRAILPFPSYLPAKRSSPDGILFTSEWYLLPNIRHKATRISMMHITFKR